jgi:hypothetical protein
MGVWKTNQIRKDIIIVPMTFVESDNEYKAVFQGKT